MSPTLCVVKKSKGRPPHSENAIVTTPMVLVATWQDGLFVVAGETLDQELAMSRSEPSHPTGMAVLSRSSTDTHFAGARRTACGAR